jgi:hypothetical protein
MAEGKPVWKEIGAALQRMGVDSPLMQRLRSGSLMG